MMSKLNSNTTELLKMLATSAVTVLTSYQAITAHIDSTVADQVRTATVQMHYAIDRTKIHADSLHLETTKHVESIRTQVEHILHRKGTAKIF